MSKANSLMEKFGANISQAVAMRPGAMPSAPAKDQADKFAGAIRSRAFGELPLDAVGRDDSQPREEFDADDLSRLALSIQRFGQLAPIRVRRDEADTRWIVLVGERRLRACKLAGLERVRVEFVEKPMTEADILAEQMVENVARANLRPVEEARAYRRLMDLNAWTIEKLAETMGIESTTVHHRIGLLRLPADIADRVDSGEIKATAAYEISKLKFADDQREVAEKIVAEGLDFNATKEEVKARRPSGKKKSRGAKSKPKRTSMTFRASNGCKLTAENRRGVDDEVVLAAIQEMAAQIRARQSGVADAA